MVFKMSQTVWAKPTGRNRYHRATIVDKIDNGEAFLLRWRKRNWNNIIICARNMRLYVASMGLARSVCGVRYHDADMAGGVPY
eukprot:11806319-Ditylum_brightwellii.AAC.1